MKEDLKTNPRNQKSINLTLILRRNRRLNKEYFFENIKSKITKNKNKIHLNYDSKLKLNTKRR